MNPFHSKKYSRQGLYLLWIFVSLTACTNSEKKWKKENLSGEYIIRNHDEFFFNPTLPRPQKSPLYPWEKNGANGLYKITKDFFRCKGSQLNPVITVDKEGKKTYYHDCSGGKNHGLPLRDGKEFVYPCLIHLLNHIQDKTGKKVVITSGHRCPQHNAYCDSTPSNWGSKHMLGAEVDFYVEGMENEPDKIVELILGYYKENYPDQKEFIQFNRYEKEGLNVKTLPWYNKEIFVKLYLEHEGRDFDNRHPYPYIGMQVRFDIKSNEKVIFDNKCAEKYLRN